MSVAAPIVSPVFVSVRKRPLFQRETSGREFDVVSAAGAEGERRLAVHDFRMASDMKTMKVQHSSFPFDEVFDETATNEEVYEARYVC